MKPRIIWTGLQWMCFSPAIFGGRVVGLGPTPPAAYQAWEKSRGACA
jgi:hypothetical protein